MPIVVPGRDHGKCARFQSDHHPQHEPVCFNDMYPQHASRSASCSVRGMLFQHKFLQFEGRFRCPWDSPSCWSRSGGGYGSRNVTLQVLEALHEIHDAKA